ncbi:MAG TPA: histidine phosphatase family protein [Xanthobacteraceae bacterium]|nr:histidine phosphatase family protein [Xanthobacteraceae bacterium]
MRRLLLLRHAKTERLEPEMRDRDRKLTARGRSDAPLIGAYMARHRLIPDLALVSPAARADETWRLVATAFRKVPRAVPDARIYNASADALAEIIGETQDAPTLLIVGHNPGLRDLAMQLIGSGEVEARERINEKLPTCGLVVIEFAFDDWSRLAGSFGRLDRFVSPQLIAQASD